MIQTCTQQGASYCTEWTYSGYQAVDFTQFNIAFGLFLSLFSFVIIMWIFKK